MQEEYVHMLCALWTLAFFIGFFGAGLFERVFTEAKAYVFYPNNDPYYYSDDDPWR